MPDMPDIPDEFKALPRKRKHPYEEWYIGKVIRINQPDDFVGDPGNVCAAALLHAKRKKFAAAAVPCLDKNGQPGSVMIWGDMDRPWTQGTPNEIKQKFLKAGVRLRR